VITEIKSIGYQQTTYDIEVADNHNYFVSGTLLHNCHSLTGYAAEASLKMIEEPPPNVRFLLATTDPQLLKRTIHSRCITLTFRKINWLELFKYIRNISDLEKLDYNEDALKFIAKTAQGSARNVLQNLQTIVGFCGNEKITIERVQQALGTIDTSLYFDLTSYILNTDILKATHTIDSLLSSGKNSGEIIKGLENHLRNLILCKTCTGDLSSFGLLDDEIKRYAHQGEKAKPPLTTKMLSLLVNVKQSVALNMDLQTQLIKFVIDSIIEMRRMTKSKKSPS
jgi:DNA polymerase-3 subunit gamma/tau